MPPAPPDADLLGLLKAARGGDPDALEGLLAELYPSIRLYAYRRLRDRRDADLLADDIAQETLLRVIRGIESCRAESPTALFGWTLVITRRVVVDLLRGRHAQIHSTPDLEEVGEHASMCEWLSRSSAPASRGSKVLSDLLDRILESLPEGMIAVLHLRVQMEMTWPEIGEHVRITASAAKRRFQRAQNRMRKALLAQILQLPPSEQQTVRQRLRHMGVDLPHAGPSDQHL